MMKISLQNIADQLKKEKIDFEITGNPDFMFDNISSVDRAKQGSITFYTGEDQSGVQNLKRCLLICKPNLKTDDLNINTIKTEDPKLAFYILASNFQPKQKTGVISKNTEIHPKSNIHESVSIGPFCKIGKCEIAEGTIIDSNVTIYDNSKIGRNCRVESNTCIGVTGIIWAYGHDGKKWSLPHLGGVIIEDSCFIGSNISIVRGSLNEDTIIKKGSMIAHGSMIGHSCILGEQSHLANNIALGGGVRLGNRCFLGSGVSIRPKVILGDDIIVGTGASVVNNYLTQGQIIAGVPAKPMKKIKDEPSAVPKPLKKAKN